MLYLGNDRHRKQVTVEVRSEGGDVLWRRQVSTRPEQVRKFLEDLRRRAEPEGGFAAIVEVCGFNDWFLKLLAEYGCRELVLIHPGKRSKKKTDRRDAGKLCELPWLNRERLLAGKPAAGLRRVMVPTARDAEDRQLTAVRRRAGGTRTRTINRIHHLLLKHNLQHECPTKGLDTQKARRWLAELPLPSMDRLEMDHLLAQWELWERQLSELNEKIEERQRASPMAALIATVPGAAAYGSLALASRIGDIERFPAPASLANYWGIVPGCRNSGDARHRPGSIAKEGSSLVRAILGQMVLHVLRRDAWMREWYRRIKARRGSKIARVAVMRRLATDIWHVVKHGQPYICGGPEKVRAARELYRTLRRESAPPSSGQDSGRIPAATTAAEASPAPDALRGRRRQAAARRPAVAPQ